MFFFNIICKQLGILHITSYRKKFETVIFINWIYNLMINKANLYELLYISLSDIPLNYN